MSKPRQCLLPILALAAAAAATAQDKRPVAFTNARLVTIAGPTIEGGTLVVRDGKIVAVGKDATVPAGARVVDATGKTIMPGLVDAHSSAGLQQEQRPGPIERTGRRGRGRSQFVPRSSGGNAKNAAATRVVDGLYARQKVFGELLDAGITSLALTPPGSAFPGLGAVLAPDGKTLAGLTADPEAFVQIRMERDAQTKKLLKENFEKAQKLVEERKKPAEKPAEKPADKPAEKPTEKPANEPPKPEPTPDPKPEPEPKPQPTPPKPEAEKAPPSAAPKPRGGARKDPNLEVLADLLEGKRRALLQIDSAADLVHWQATVPESTKFPRAVVVTNHNPYEGTFDMVVDQIRQLECTVLLPTSMTTKGRSRSLVHPAKTLHDAGLEVGFVLPEGSHGADNLFYALMELVRCGLPADVALRGVTLVPAKALGIDASVGSLEVGKDANLILLSGDPLSPASAIESVWFHGRAVERQNP
ncbi:MAG: amidohydrolase family protein [Planctomycetes bacterium]|nr:amidohydrolase family protein [Planctomycetota bacterium]